MNKKRKVVSISLVFLAFVALALAIYFTFFYYYKCNDAECFLGHQEKCSKTEYYKDDAKATWFYRIKGRKGDKCEIEVKLVQLKEGYLDLRKLEGDSMICELEIGSIVPPESEISRCHGLLREKLQEAIIRKLHAYIVENIGDIAEELREPL